MWHWEKDAVPCPHACWSKYASLDYALPWVRDRRSNDPSLYSYVQETLEKIAAGGMIRRWKWWEDRWWLSEGLRWLRSISGWSWAGIKVLDCDMLLPLLLRHDLPNKSSHSIVSSTRLRRKIGSRREHKWWNVPPAIAKAWTFRWEIISIWRFSGFTRKYRELAIEKNPQKH